MRLVIAGPGRAGGALAIGASGAGHEVTGLFSRSARVDRILGLPIKSYDELAGDGHLPLCDLLIIATRDAAISAVAQILAPFVKPATAAIHLSGFASVSALYPLAQVGVETGSFHPLQSLPDSVRGARALAGAWVAVTAGPSLTTRLNDFAVTMSMRPFGLADDRKPHYHAGATAASNYVVAALDMAYALFERASVPFEALEPLTSATVRNAFNQGPSMSLTGPIARGDWETVAGQMHAVEALGDDRARQFRLMAEATAITAGKTMPEDL